MLPLPGIINQQAEAELNPVRYGLSDQRLGMGGLKGPPKFMAVLEPNKANLCYY